MRYLLDTNILLRLNKPNDADYQVVRSAVDALWAAGHDLCCTPQNMAEFWNVCTRPTDRNGFGLSVPESDRRAKRIESDLVFLPDNDRIYVEWRRIVVARSVRGVQVHDARLAAAMVVHGLSHIVTLNVGDFSRFPEITALHPRQVALP